MKINHLICFFIVIFICIACTLETSNNGKLDGYWKLCSIDTVATGGHLDLNSKNLFWAIQLNLLELKNTDQLNDGPHFMRFRQTKDSLFLQGPMTYDKLHGDTIITDINTIAPFGINATECAFKILRLTSSRMQLQDDDLRLQFKKF